MEGDSSPCSSTSLISSSAIMNYENEQQNLEIQALKPMIEEMKEKLSKMRERIAQKIDVQDARTVEKDAVAEIEINSSQINPSSTPSLLKNFDAENERIAQEIKTMEPMMDEIKEENAQMLERIVQHIDVQNAKIAEKEQKIEEIKQTLADVQKKYLGIMSHLIETHKAEIIKLQEEHEKEKKELQIGISERDKTISKMEENVANAITKKEQKIQEIKQSFDHLIATHKAENIKLQEEHEKEKEELQAGISERDKIISNLDEDLNNVKKGHEEEKEKLQAEIIQLKNSEAEKRKLIEQEKKIAELENEAKAHEVEQLKQTLSGLQKSLDESAAEKTQTMNEIAELLIKLNAFQEENDQLKNEIASLRPIVVNSKSFREMDSESQEIENPIPLDFSICELQATDLQSNDPHDFFTVEEYLNTDESERKDIFSNRILLTMDLIFNGEKWFDKCGVEIPLDDSNCKLYVRRHLKIKSLPATESTLIDRLNSNSSFWSLYLGYLTISFDDYKKLLTKSNIYSLTIDRITVTDEYGTLITVDQLLKEVPNIDAFDYTFIDGEKMDGIAQKLVELPLLPKVQTFRLWNIQEGFDLKTIIQFIKSNAIIKPYATSYWRFQYNVTEKKFAEIKRIHKEIVSTLPSSCRPTISNRTR